MNSFYTSEELRALGLCSYGEDVLISRHARFYNPESISLGHHVRIDDFCILSGGAGIRIGNFVHIGPYSALYGGAGIELADFSGISSRVALYSESDDFSGESLTNPMVPIAYKPGFKRGKITVGRHAVIGTNASILPGVVLEEGAAVGAHALVTRNCQSWSIYAGTPARRIAERSRALLALETQFLRTVALPHHP